MKKIYLNSFQVISLFKKRFIRFAFCILMFVFFTGLQSKSQTTYIWNQTGTASWAVSSNWSPSRVTPATSDILVFNNGATTTVTNIPTETIGQLSVSLNTTVNLQGAAAGIIVTIGGGAGTDLTVATGSALNINVATNTTTVLVGTGATAIVSGNMTFSAAAHKLNAADANGIIFNSPAVITQDAGCSGNLFTNAGTANAVVFNTGTVFVQNIGANPFGLTAPATKTVFNAGSLFKLQQNAAPSFSGRIYADLEINAAAFSQSPTGAGLLTIDNLTITLGILNINLTTAGVNIKGNISVAAGQSLTFFPGSASTLVLNGASAQSITNAGTLIFGANESVTLNNTAGLVLNNSITINGILTLTAGKITTGNNTLTISNTTAGAIVGADATKYVIATGTTGGLQRSVAASINSYDFPIGSATDYKPATINFTTAPSVAGALTARFKTGYPGFPNAVVLTDGAITNINAVSFQGSWFIDASGGLTGGIYTSTFVGNGTTDVLDYTKTVLLKRPTAGGDWTLDGTLIATTGSNTQPSLSRTGMVGFSEFGLGGELLVALPISLNYLNGYKQSGIHNLNWKVTCTNNATATMSIERSATGRNFTNITTITADALRCQQPFDYTDNNPLQGSNYYRLKMTDANGKVTYSAVIVLLNAATGFDIVGLSPNLINSNAILNVTAAQKTKMDVVITDMAGRQVQKIAYNLIAGSNQFTINLANLVAGTYQITGYSTEGKSKTIRFTKQ
jgi:hypothetical protein